MTKFIQRKIMPNVLHWLGKNKILILKGSRQVGKTTLLKIIKKKLEDEGKKTFYLSVDLEFDNPILKNAKNFLRFLDDQFPKNSDMLYIFMDEFQYLPNGGLFLKNVFDAKKDQVQIIASGSSRLEITKTSEFLTGRKIEFNLYPLDYYEYLTFKTNLTFPQELPINNFKQIVDFYALYKDSITSALNEYLSFGGYPEVVTTKIFADKITILKELIRTYIDKDIIAFLRIENVSGFNNLLKILCAQTGNLVNKSELANTVNLSIDTVNKYLDILEGTYILEFVKPHFQNVRKQVSKMQKVYVDDAGLRNIVLNRSLPMELIGGQERENFVYNCLKHKYGKENVKFFRTISKAEIDFILELPDCLIPIEVKSTRKKMPIPQLMRKFESRYSIIVTDDFLEKQGNSCFIPTVLMPFVKF